MNTSKMGLILRKPFYWVKKLSEELHWSFVSAVVLVYGINQGMSLSLIRISTQYYMKDEQKLQPSEAQVYSGIIQLPWVVKPLWGFLTDTLPIFGYRRRPYFALGGFIGVVAMLSLSINQNLHLASALLCLMGGSAGAAIADVTIDACVTENSINHPSLASDMQSLCGLSSSVGQLIGYAISGFLVQLIGSKGVFGLLSIPSSLVILVGMITREAHGHNVAYKRVSQKFVDAGKAMWMALKCENVWRPCIYMFLSLAVSLHIHEGMFYWYTEAKDGPSFSKEMVGSISSVGAVGSLLGDAAFSQMIGRLKWMPLLVLSSKLCPSGIEGTFFALLMSIDHIGILTASWGGGLLLHAFNVTRTQFDNLWIVVAIRSILRMLPVCILFLIPSSDPNAAILPSEMLKSKKGDETLENQNMEMAPLVSSLDQQLVDT
ncbi:probable folate-biopterin transporter 3 isoform X2 [Capsicum annuum]|uniref:probable folate-biopterin transporter 3 isoform X2 n=1 Tax=Capsicum annuum TaxID=4072 RepID=UPI0007BFE0CB|nr:probable folate-biopterin transporter 3 isoform X2 [Capsicum annuum]